MRQTWWFLGGSSLALGIWSLWRFRMQQLTRQLQLRFDDRLIETARAAQDVHDNLLQGLLSASMQLHVASEALPKESQGRHILTRTLQSMRQVIEEDRDAIRRLQSPGHASLDLESAFFQVHQELVVDDKVHEIGFRVIVDGRQRPLQPLLRDDIYRIGREALINAIRHARADSIEVELEYSTSQLRVHVRDNGRGLAPSALNFQGDGRWGLSGMRERADQIGARLHLYSRLGAGTQIDLCVPGHIAFQGHARRTLPWFRKRLRTGARQWSAERGKSE